jgi:hypothetical protein
MEVKIKRERLRISTTSGIFSPILEREFLLSEE